MVENMLNDVTNGNLRKKARRNHFGKGFALSDSDDEQELLRSLKRAGARYSLMSKNKDEEGLTTLERFASNPKTSAFAKCFVTFDSEDEKGMMTSSEEETCFSTVRAQLTKDMALKLSRSKSSLDGGGGAGGGGGLKRAASGGFLPVSRNGSTVSAASGASRGSLNRGGSSSISICRASSSITTADVNEEDDQVSVVKKKVNIDLLVVMYPKGSNGLSYFSTSDRYLDYQCNLNRIQIKTIPKRLLSDNAEIM
ncbi:hypothetical protein BDR26DRAFT_590550 [Obelidium mucronatum]|nr:hypothetical protein BDR26DRAFT_590550 [Obelidium mucronatum]